MSLKSLQALVDKIRVVKDEADFVAFLRELAPENLSRPVRLGFINAHAFNLAFDNPQFLSDLMGCDYLLRDGSGMKILFKMLDREPGLNMNGTDFIPRLFDVYKGRTAALMGTNSHYLERAAERISAQGVDPVIKVHGFDPEAAYQPVLEGKGIPLVILAMGMPKQERVAALIAQASPDPSLIVCGGAVLDFIGGKVSRAPEILRRYGLEWVYRLAQEPRRLFKRYVIGNGVFLWRAFRLMRQRQQGERTLNILHVVRQYDPAIGGLESYVKSMAQHQQALGHKCTVLTLNRVFHGDGQELPSQETINGIEIRRVGFWGRRRFFIPKVSPFFFRRYDIVHVHNTDMFYDYIALAGLLTGTPCVATTHGGFFHTQDFSLIKKVYFNLITRITSLAYKTIFAISQNDFDTFKGLNKRVLLEPNAIEPLGQEIAHGQDFLYIGRLAAHKNIDKVIEVFAVLKKDYALPGHLHIVGPEWDVTHAELKNKADSLGISADVMFHGSATRADMGRIAQTCGYFISASAFEGFGMSMLEGMSVGLIPLVHNNESFKELVAQGGVGLATDFGNTDETARLIDNLLPQLTMDDRLRARTFAARFSWPELSASTVRIYEEFARG